MIDRATGQALSTTTAGDSHDYSSATRLSEVVAALPETVRDEFAAHDEGVRYAEG